MCVVSLVDNILPSLSFIRHGENGERYYVKTHPLLFVLINSFREEKRGNNPKMEKVFDHKVLGSTIVETLLRLMTGSFI